MRHSYHSARGVPLACKACEEVANDLMVDSLIIQPKSDVEQKLNKQGAGSGRDILGEDALLLQVVIYHRLNI